MYHFFEAAHPAYFDDEFGLGAKEVELAVAITEIALKLHAHAIVLEFLPEVIFCHFLSVHPTNQAGTALYHALVDHFFEGFVLEGEAQVVEEHIPEAGIDKVSGGMFGSAQIEVDLLPVVIGFFAEILIRIFWIHIAQVISAGAGESGHGIGFEGIAFRRLPVSGTCQWRFA